MTRQQIEQIFPALLFARYEITSPSSTRYNCIAWAAARDQRKWWDPDPKYYWPPGAPRERTVEAYVIAFEALGFVRCDGAALEVGFEKVAIYVHRHGHPTHAARQLPSGEWTSKLGPSEDIEHSTLESLTGIQYGAVRVFMRRPLPRDPQQPGEGRPDQPGIAPQGAA